MFAFNANHFSSISGVSQSLQWHRPLQMQNRRMDDSHDSIEAFILSKKKSMLATTPQPSAEILSAAPGPNEVLPDDEFTHTLRASTKVMLWDIIKAKKADDGSAADVWCSNTLALASLKHVLIAALRSAFRSAPDDQDTPAQALSAFKMFCDNRDSTLPYVRPSKPWAPGAAPQQPKKKRPIFHTLQQALASAPNEELTIEMFSTLAWDPKKSPFN